MWNDDVFGHRQWRLLPKARTTVRVCLPQAFLKARARTSVSEYVTSHRGLHKLPFCEGGLGAS